MKSQLDLPPLMLEMLKDYPDVISDARSSLMQFSTKARWLSAPYQSALWLLKDILGDEVSKSSVDIRNARASGDHEAMAKALARQRAMFQAQSVTGGLADTSDLRNFFQGMREP